MLSLIPSLDGVSDVPWYMQEAYSELDDLWTIGFRDWYEGVGVPGLRSQGDSARKLIEIAKTSNEARQAFAYESLLYKALTLEPPKLGSDEFQRAFYQARIALGRDADGLTHEWWPRWVFLTHLREAGGIVPFVRNGGVLGALGIIRLGLALEDTLTKDPNPFVRLAAIDLLLHEQIPTTWLQGIYNAAQGALAQLPGETFGSGDLEFETKMQSTLAQGYHNLAATIGSLLAAQAQKRIMKMRTADGQEIDTIRPEDPLWWPWAAGAVTALAAGLYEVSLLLKRRKARRTA